MMAAMGIKTPKHGFTLVELMIAIVIIGILMAIAIPAVNRTIVAAKQTKIRLEINALEQAVEQYMQKFGDYPPDGSSQDVVIRHMRRRFPRIAEPDVSLLTRLTSVRGTTTPSAVAMDRAEALVFFLGGFSDDSLHPLTGEGGPVALIPGRTAGSTNIDDYQYNATRDNSLFDFDPSRLTYARANDTAPLLSVDESVWSGADLNEAGGVDVLPVYLSGGAEPAPIVYFDSRTYGLVAPGVYNGFRHPTLGAIRPYKTGRDIKPPGGATYGSVDAAFAAVPFHNPKTFQIISPGLDGLYGTLVGTAGGLPVHYITETGTPVFPNDSAANPAGLAVTAPGIGPRFQEGGTEVNGHLDNITNFSASTLEDDLQ
ncbi:MAG TPA: protein containing Prepilin-type cleavage/methylation [Planctomycetaceae bacterium]|nr:protein containing Prepilin-type cleavage/methylation [Planctomycetaceae bacterium]